MAVARNDLAALERVPDEVFELVVAGVVADLAPELLQPDEDFLVGQSVEGSGEAVESGGEGEVRVGKGGSDEVGRVGGDVASFVVGVDGQVESQELDELGVVVAQLQGEVVGPVLVGVHGTDTFATCNSSLGIRVGALFCF